MIFLGIDPGLAKMGLGVVECCKNRTLTYVHHDTITTKASETKPDRFFKLATALFDVIEKYKPDHVAIEKTFVNVNASSSLMLAEIRGGLYTIAALHSLPLSEYANTTIKKAVTGHGHAGKEGIEFMIPQLLKNIPPDVSIKKDAADALAIAICCAFHF